MQLLHFNWRTRLATAQDIAKGWLGADGKALAVAEGLIQEMAYGEKEEDSLSGGGGTRHLTDTTAHPNSDNR